MPISALLNISEVSPTASARIVLGRHLTDERLFAIIADCPRRVRRARLQFQYGRPRS